MNKKKKKHEAETLIRENKQTLNESMKKPYQLFFLVC